MSAPLRFLGLAIIAYVGIRAAGDALALEPMGGQPASAASQPGAAVDPAEAGLSPPPAPDAVPAPPFYYGPNGYGAAGQMAGPPPMVPPGYAAMPYMIVPAAMTMPPRSRPYFYPAPYAQSYAGPAPPEIPAAPTPESLSAGAGYGAPAPPLDQWPAIRTAGPFSVGTLQRTPSWDGGDRQSNGFASTRADRIRIDAWALVRPPREGLYPIDDPDAGINPGLASAGSLGGSQAGLRLTWKPTGRLGVHLRASTALLPQGRRGQTLAGGEGAAGISWQPLGALPVRVTAERRQRLGPALGGGRNAFALFAEGGVYDRPLVAGLKLDGYGQAGVVGFNRRDLFADGALAATYGFRPRLAFGGGLWAGVQPGLSRFDAGPRLSYQLSPRLRLHLDYRFRVTGNALPASGPALTVAGGF